MKAKFALLLIKNQANFHYTRSITPKRVTSGGAHLHDLAPVYDRSTETSQQRQPVGETMSNLTGPRIKPILRARQQCLKPFFIKLHCTWSSEHSLSGY